MRIRVAAATGVPVRGAYDNRAANVRTTPNRRIVAILLAVLSLAVGTAAGDIWVKGSVDAALATAQKAQKPVFIYWCSSWEPVCSELEEGLFKQPAFERKMQEFVAVHIDADTPGAQALGEVLAVVGYPTLIVLSPNAAELTRLPSTLLLQPFLEALDAAVASPTPVQTVLARVEATVDLTKVPAPAWRMLGSHSWNQDRSVLRDFVALQKTFHDLDTKVPVALTSDKARLFTRWLGFAILNKQGGKDDGRVLALGSSDRKAADERAREILASADLVRRNLDFVLYGADDTVRLLQPSPGSGRDTLIAAWEAAAAGLRSDSSLSVAQRLAAMQPTLELRVFHSKSKDSTHEADVRAEVLRLVEVAEKQAASSAGRQAAMPIAGWLLSEVGEGEAATALLTRQLGRARMPSHFMSLLGKRAEEAGDAVGAVSWARKGYEASTGAAARAEWGTSYLMAMLRLTPDAVELIQKESLQILTEAIARSDAFAGEQSRQFAELADGYAGWASRARKRFDALRAIRKGAGGGCATRAGTGKPSPRDPCQAFLDQLGQR